MARSANTLLQLLPRGAAWARSLTSGLGLLLSAIGEEFDRIEDRARDLLREALPSTADELLAEWEELVGAREITSGVYSSLASRRASVVARLEGEVLSRERIRRYCDAWTRDGGEVDGLYFIDVERAGPFEVTVVLEGPTTLAHQAQLRALGQIHGTLNVRMTQGLRTQDEEFLFTQAGAALELS